MSSGRKTLTPRSTHAGPKASQSSRAQTALERAASSTHNSGRPKRAAANVSYGEDENGFHVLHHGQAATKSSAITSSNRALAEAARKVGVTKRGAGGAGPVIQKDFIFVKGPNGPVAVSTVGGRNNPPVNHVDHRLARPVPAMGAVGGQQEDEYEPLIPTDIESEDGEEGDGEERAQEAGRGRKGRDGDDAEDELEDDDEEDEYEYDAENEASTEQAAAPSQSKKRKRTVRAEEKIAFAAGTERAVIQLNKPLSKRHRLEALQYRQKDAELNGGGSASGDDDNGDSSGAYPAEPLSFVGNGTTLTSLLFHWRGQRKYDKRHRLLVNEASLGGEFLHFHAAKRLIVDGLASTDPWPTIEAELTAVGTAWTKSFDSQRDVLSECPPIDNEIQKALRTRIGAHRSEIFRIIKSHVPDWYDLTTSSQRKARARLLSENFNWSWRSLETSPDDTLVRKGCFGHPAILRSIELCFFSPTPGNQGIGLTLPSFAESIPSASIALVSAAIFASLRNIAEGHEYTFNKDSYGDVYEKIQAHYNERLRTGRLLNREKYAHRLREEAAERAGEEEALKVGEGYNEGDVSDSGDMDW